MIRRKRMRSWSASSNLQPDVCKEEEERRVGALRHHDGNEMVEEKGSTSGMVAIDHRLEEDEEEVPRPPLAS